MDTLIMGAKKTILEAIVETLGKVPPEMKKKKSVELQKSIAAKKVDYSTKTRKMRGIKESVEEWTNYDFALYIRQKFYQRYKKNCNMARIGLILWLPELKDFIVETKGFCDEILLKDYIDYFFDSWSDYFVSKDKTLYVRRFKEERVIKSFADDYDYKKAVQAHVEGKVTPKVVEQKISYPTEQRLDKLYRLSVDKMLLEYGLVITANYLIVKKHLKKEAAIAVVDKSITHIGNREEIVKVTQRYDPYPEYLALKEFDSTLQRISKIPIKLSFSACGEELSFLKG